MSGSPRELLRDSKGVRWASSKDQAVMADAALNHPFFPELPLDDAARAQGSYQFRLAGSDRVAGHSGRRLDIVPKDAFRYGYSLWLETQSALLLQWKLSTSEGKDLARLMFTDFRIGSEVDRSELHSGMTGQRLHQLDSGIPAETGSARGQPGWKAKRLPPGFRLASHRQQKTTDGGFFEHSVYSDGIATVSVYVESADDGASIQRGLSRLGTTHAFTRDAEGYFITVIGDVPAATVKMIAEAVNHSDS